MSFQQIYSIIGFLFLIPGLFVYFIYSSLISTIIISATLIIGSYFLFYKNGYITTFIIQILSFITFSLTGYFGDLLFDLLNINRCLVDDPEGLCKGLAGMEKSGFFTGIGFIILIISFIPFLIRFINKRKNN